MNYAEDSLIKSNTADAIESRDWSVLEDHPAYLTILSQLCAQAGRNAAAEAKAKGLPQVFVRDEQVMQRYSDGSEEILTSAKEEGKKEGQYFIQYPLSVLLPHAK